MKKLISLILVCAIALGVTSSALAKAKTVKYSMEKDGVVLQDVEDRNIQPQASLERHPIIEGESPTTGLAWSGEYQPMLVQIVQRESKNVDFNGEKLYGVGIGYGTPWGGQYADIVYEQCLRKDGFTRMTFLFSDSFAEGQPTDIGPIRSARMGHIYLAKEWQAGLVHAGGPKESKFGNNIYATAEELGLTARGLQIDLTRSNDWNDYKYRLANITNLYALTAKLNEIRNALPSGNSAEPRAFLFTDTNPYLDGYDIAYSVNLDWGNKLYISHFYYDETENVYLRYSNKTPYTTYPTADDASNFNVDSRLQMSFANVIVQRVPYDYANDKVDRPLMKALGKGNADIFIGGRYIPGYWVRENAEDPTIYLDDKGNEIQLQRGKTFIAQFPPESLLTYQGVQ